MTQPINLYIQSRVADETSFNRIDRHSSGKLYRTKTQTHEIKSLRNFVDILLCLGVLVENLDGFYYGYKIPQIGKEFDLLKFGKDECLNIELKSQDVPEKQILTQLNRNSYYLSHLGKRISQYTVITTCGHCYGMDNNGQLQPVSFSELSQKIRTFELDSTAEIDKMFRASDFLVSPLNTPEKFINGSYFLTQAQEEIKKEIITSIFCNTGHQFFSISGKPGTGKTLLLYDIAKSLSVNSRTAVLHCGKLADGQIMLNESIQNFGIVSAGQLKYDPQMISSYRYVLVDEAHRIYPAQFESLCKNVITNEQSCIFSSDPDQVLSNAEKRNGITKKINDLTLVGKYELSEKIRTNKELASFIISMRNLSKRPHVPMDYSNVTLSYANNVQEAKNLVEYFRKRGYTFINYSKSNYCYSPYSVYEEDFDTHHVIGQEFDNVLMLMDNSFYYDSDGKLQGIPHPNPDYLYPNLFYQGITRVREKVAIIVVDAPELFEKITSIVEMRS